MIEVQIERDRIVEAEIFGVKGIVLDHAHAERHHPPALTPDEEPGAVRHHASEGTEISLRQLLEMQRRSLVNLQIERVRLIDYRRQVVDKTHLDRRRPLGGSEFLAQVLARLAAEPRAQVFVEALVIDAKTSVGKARHSSEAGVKEACERRAIGCGKLLEHD